MAHDVLSQTEFDEAEEISRMLASSRSKRIAAVERLTQVVSPPPKRPIYYAQHELEHLPRWTRDAIRDLGDYIDLLAKHLAFHLTQDTRVRDQPLGAVVRFLESTPSAPQPLVSWLKRYNSFLYRPGKHDFKLPSDRKGHRFTSREVVLTAFLTMNLAGRIKLITNCLPELNCHHDA